MTDERVVTIAILDCDEDGEFSDDGIHYIVFRGNEEDAMAIFERLVKQEGGE